MTKQPTSHFSLTDCRRILTEHEHPLLTLTKGEYEALVGRLEKARDCIADYLAELEERCPDALEWSEALNQWLASLEAGK